METSIINKPFQDGEYPVITRIKTLKLKKGSLFPKKKLRTGSESHNESFSAKFSLSYQPALAVCNMTTISGLRNNGQHITTPKAFIKMNTSRTHKS